LDLKQPKMYIHQFKRHYDLDLIPAAHADISLGDLVWRRKKRAPLLSRKGLPNNIYNVFLVEGIVNERQWREAMSFFESDELIPAELGDLQIETDRRFTLSFHHPVVQLFQSDTTLKSEIQFAFYRIHAHVLSNKWRILLQKNLDQLSLKAEKEIFKRYRPVHLITELYYGNIQLKIAHSLAHKIKPLLKASPSEAPLTHVKQGKFDLYEFKHQHVPFAMRLEALKNFRS